MEEGEKTVVDIQRIANKNSKRWKKKRKKYILILLLLIYRYKMSPIRLEFASDLAKSDCALEVSHCCTKESGWNLIGPSFQFKFFTWGSWVEGFFFSEFRVKGHAGHNSFVEFSYNFIQVVSICVVNNFVVKILEITKRKGQ